MQLLTELSDSSSINLDFVNKTLPGGNLRISGQDPAVDHSAKHELHKKDIFPFMKLPGELRCYIYELLLTPIHREPQKIEKYNAHEIGHIVDQVDRVILGNGLLARAAFGVCNGYTKRDCWCVSCLRPSDFGMHLSTPTMKLRIEQNSRDIPALLEISILRLCRQVYHEAIHTLYSKNTFAVIAPLNGKFDMEKFSRYRHWIYNTYPIHKWFPAGIDMAKIEHFRLEVQIDTDDPYVERDMDTLSSSLQYMGALKNLQIIFTYDTYDEDEVESCHIKTLTKDIKKLAAAIPVHVENITWGMTRAELERGDFGGFSPVDGDVVRKLLNDEGTEDEDENENDGEQDSKETPCMRSLKRISSVPASYEIA